VSKYCDHLPLYHQKQIFAQRHKVNLPRQTLARWVELGADWLLPTYKQIRTGVMAGGHVQADETPVAYLSPGNGRTKQGYLWTACRPGEDVFYRWETSRAATCLDALLASEFSGILQCDGYNAYPAYASRRAGIRLAGCWAHLRRSSTRPANQLPNQPRGFCRNSSISTALNPNFGSKEPVPHCGKLPAPHRAVRSLNAYAKRCSC
jgi:hypothetical protein